MTRVFVRLAMADTHEEAIDAAHRHGAITPPRLHDCSGGAGIVGVIEVLGAAAPEGPQGRAPLGSCTFPAPVAAPLASGEQPAAGALSDVELADLAERWAAGLLASLEVGS